MCHHNFFGRGVLRRRAGSAARRELGEAELEVSRERFGMIEECVGFLVVLEAMA